MIKSDRFCQTLSQKHDSFEVETFLKALKLKLC